MKKIIVLRKIGITVEELTPPLGAKQLCAALLDAAETIDSMDADVYTAALHEAEANGLTFEDISRDRMGNSKFTRTFAKLCLFESFDTHERKDLLFAVLEVFAITLICGLIDLFKGQESIWIAILYPLGGLSLFGAFYLLNLFGRKHPKGAMHILSVVLGIGLTALTLLVLLIIVLVLNSIFHFWY